jgi:alpha-tubulin suppressor-like RCC1 family protein
MKTSRKLIQTCLLYAVLLQAVTGFAQPLTQIAAGDNHSFFLKSDGSLWAMGYNQYGELGDGMNNNTNRPEQIVASNVTAVAAGYIHSLFLKSDGSLWAMGYNYDGELGDGVYNTHSPYGTNQPQQIVASNVTAIAAGEYHSLFIKSDGSLWAMGRNDSGQLGDGTYNYSGVNVPEQIVASNVTAIAAGGYTSLFLKSDGSLWAMGDNGNGELGDGTTDSGNYETNLPEQIIASNVTAIAEGFSHSMFLKNDGSLWVMGYNYYNQLGDGTSEDTNRPTQIVASNVTAIAAGFYHSLFLKNDGSLWGMGYNADGELGDGTYNINSTNIPTQIVANNIMLVASKGGQTLFLKNDGGLWGMGYNADGELGDGTYSNTNRPEQILGAFNQITDQILGGTDMRLSFVGVANANYALDRSSSLSPPNWIPQATNAAGSSGALAFTNAPDATTNNFWRVRSVQ